MSERSVDVSLDRIKRFTLISCRNAAEGLRFVPIKPAWEDESSFETYMVEEKTILTAFLLGVEKAHRWTDFYQPLTGFCEVMKKIGENIHLLRFAIKNGNLAISDSVIQTTINTLIDTHMRSWIVGNTQIQRWIADDLIDANSILQAAAVHLHVERNEAEKHLALVVKEVLELASKKKSSKKKDLVKNAK